MPSIVGVKFRSSPKIYHLRSGGLTLRRGVKVVAESFRGLEIGQVTAEPREIPMSADETEIPLVQRVATVSDIQLYDRAREYEIVAYNFCQERIRSRGLQMKLVDVYCAFDDSKITFYFTAEGRVDFRMLLRDLNAEFRPRIHLYQIGARDAARLIGGLGPCGQELCCTRWIREFDPISMKMAKDQNLFLNPSKFSGVCGKLMCCLRYEHEVYLLARDAMPCVGDRLDTPRGTGTVVELMVPKEAVLVDVPNFGLIEVPTPVQVQAKQPRCRSGGGCSASDCGNCGSHSCDACGATA